MKGDMHTSIRCSLVFAATAVGVLAPAPSAPAAAADTCGGVVFVDLDGDGNRREALVRDGLPGDLEPGVAGVTVTITDRTGTTSSALTDDGGRWWTALDGSRFPIRVDVDPPAGMFDSAAGPTSATTTQFITSPDECGGPIGSVGLLDPAAYCADHAPLAVACQVRADVDDASPDEPVVRVISAATRDTAITDAVTDGEWLTEPAETLATVGEVGTVYGLATAPDGRVFAAAFVKRHTRLVSQLNPTGNPTAIYELRPGRRPRLLTVLDPTATDPHQVGGRIPDHDTAVMDDVFREGIGDLELSADGRRLYAVDLGRRAIVAVDPDDGATIETTPLDGIRLGTEGCGVSGADPFGDLRPFGLALDHEGDLLVGVVCSAASTVGDGVPIDDGDRPDGETPPTGAGDHSALVGLVFELTDGRFRERLRWPLAGRRGETADGDGIAHEAAWHPWVDEYPFTTDHAVVSYPQPAITDLAVDAAGNLVLALGDRWSHQTSPHSIVPSADGHRSIDESIAAGDLQRACPAGDGWAIEGSDGCRGGIGDGWEFFRGDRYGWHSETPLGSLAATPGHHDVIATQMNPLTVDGAWHSGGLAWHDTRTGDAIDGLRVYDGRNIRPDSTFEHASGMGDVELLCGEIPIVFGGRIWYDADGDGADDPAEPPIPGVPVELLDPNGRTIATGRTGPDGRYQFDGRDIERGLDRGKRYTIVVAEEAFRAGVFGPGGAWTGLRPTAHQPSGRIELGVIAGDDPSTAETEPPIRQHLDLAMTDQYDLALHAELAGRDDDLDVLRLDVVVVNQGSRPSGAFAVTSRVPPGVELVAAGDADAPATVDGDLVTWHVEAADGLAPGESRHLPIRVRVGRRGTTEHVYAAQLVAHDGVDDDSTPGNALLEHPGSLPRLDPAVRPIDHFGSPGWEDDAGALYIRLSTLAGSIWFDHDRDGTRDLDPAAEESFAAGVEVRLLREDRTEFARTTTDVDGWFEFPLLETGTYRIELPGSNFEGALRGYDVIVRPDGSLVDAAGGYVSGTIELTADRSTPVTVTHLGVAERSPSSLLGGAGPLLIGPGLVLGTYGLLSRQRRRNRLGGETFGLRPREVVRSRGLR
jgi:hypothetical protein